MPNILANISTGDFGSLFSLGKNKNVQSDPKAELFFIETEMRKMFSEELNKSQNLIRWEKM